MKAYGQVRATAKMIVPVINSSSTLPELTTWPLEGKAILQAAGVTAAA